ncbi:FeoA family protein [Alteromonas sp. ASW11-130]|uniref:FeoA family protein n=1 Tax=Alteromonas sp. ASW11-130 TaxID=3015775 RepID=UPI0022422B07|nr:FeoA family protein [Alteromonas sp. ASW11-130]MCW8091117.1 ferrous iron transport protein A [Alteromonas sp. ASW11-130]
MTLWDLSTGDLATVSGIAEDVADNVKLRLVEMGIQKGRDLKCVRRGPFNGPIVLQLGGSVFALEQDIAKKVGIRQ